MSSVDELSARLDQSRREISDHFEAFGSRPTEPDWIIMSLVRQSITPSEKGEYFSEFIRAYADALRHLCRVGIMIPLDGYNLDEGDRVFSARLAHKDMRLL